MVRSHFAGNVLHQTESTWRKKTATDRSVLTAAQALVKHGDELADGIETGARLVHSGTSDVEIPQEPVGLRSLLAQHQFDMNHARERTDLGDFTHFNETAHTGNQQEESGEIWTALIPFSGPVTAESSQSDTLSRSAPGAN